MRKRERAAAAAKWRRIARAFERNVRRGEDEKACGTASHGLCWAAYDYESPVIQLFRRRELRARYWPYTRQGDDCRVIAAGLIAAMYETGEFDD